MLHVVKEIISSVSIDPLSNTDSSSSDPDSSSESELSATFDRNMNLSSSTIDSVDKSSMEDPKVDLQLKLVETPVDEYLNKFLESIVRRFYEQKSFEEYSKVRDYNFGKSKLELLSKFRENSNLKEFIVNGVIDVPMENLLALVMELSNRTKWDDTYLEHSMLGFDEPTKTDFIFSVSKYPFPLTRRTYVVTRTCYSFGEDCLVVLSAATNKVPQPKKMKWATHVDEFESLLVVKNCEPEDVGGVMKVTKSFMLATYFENPKRSIDSDENFFLAPLSLRLLSQYRRKFRKIKEKMIVTEVDSSPEDSEGCSNVEVVEVAENDNVINFEILKSLNYYLEEENINNDCCNLILEEMVKPISLKDELEFEEYFLSNENNSKEFKVESFTKTLKTLVDIATEPIVDECPSISSTGSESSDNESFSIMPMLKTISTKFIKQTSRFFKTDNTDMINLSIASSESNERDIAIIDANSGEELEGNNCSDKYQIEEYFLDVKEYNESEVRNYPTREDNTYNSDEITKDNKKEIIQEYENKEDKDIKEKENKEEKNHHMEGNNNNDNNNEKENNDSNEQVVNKNVDWNISNLGKWF